MAGLWSSFAKYERELIRERIMLKLEYARSQGRKGGRRHKLNAEQAALAKRMHDAGRQWP